MARGALPGPGRSRCRGGRAAGRLRDHGRADGRPHRAASPTAFEELARDARRHATRGALADDPAIAACARASDPGAERGDGLHRGAPRRAPRRGPPLRLAVDARALRASSSTRTARPAAPGRAMLIRRAWVGEPPREQLDAAGRRLPQLRAERGRAALGRRRDASASRRRRGGRRRSSTPLHAAGADALNLRVHVPGRRRPTQAREQIVRLGDEVLPGARALVLGSRHRRSSR